VVVPQIKQISESPEIGNGSYITDKKYPRDYDAVWEFAGTNNTIDPLLRDGTDLWAIKRKYGGDVLCEIPGLCERIEYFQTDRLGISKGIIKINLENIDE